MQSKKFENKDHRPKRRMHKDNPYRIFSVGKDTSDPHYYIKFLDAQKVEVCVEITGELFAYFDKCELADLSLLNEQDRHTDNMELTPYLMNVLTNQPLDPLLEHMAKSDEAMRLHKAIMMLPDKQRRRLLMHYWGSMSYEQIGQIEGCTFQVVHRSIEKAIRNLKEILKNLQ